MFLIAVTCITEDNFRERIWHLPACEMMGVGPATYRALQKRCIRTIGQIAQTPPGHLRTWLGKNGDTLWRYANGLDTAEVIPCARAAPMQSISRGMTPLRDMENEAECAAFLTEMAQEVGRRLRKNRLYAGGVKISIRDTKLCSREFQCTLATPTMHTDVIARAAVQLLKTHYRWQNPLRSASVTAIQLTPEHTPAQMDILYDPALEEKRDHLDQTIDTLRRKYGSHSVCSASYFTLTAPGGKKNLISPDRDWSPAFSLGEGLRDRPADAIPFGTLF